MHMFYNLEVDWRGWGGGYQFFGWGKIDFSLGQLVLVEFFPGDACTRSCRFFSLVFWWVAGGNGLVDRALRFHLARGVHFGRHVFLDGSLVFTRGCGFGGYFGSFTWGRATSFLYFLSFPRFNFSWTRFGLTGSGRYYFFPGILRDIICVLTRHKQGLFTSLEMTIFLLPSLAISLEGVKPLPKPS